MDLEQELGALVDRMESMVERLQAEFESYAPEDPEEQRRIRMLWLKERKAAATLGEFVGRRSETKTLEVGQ